MRKFTRPKTHYEFLAACDAAGHSVDTSGYDYGDDHVRVYGNFAGRSLKLSVATCTGKFIANVDGEIISETSNHLDGTDWYDAILDLVYVTADAKVGG